MIPSTYTAWKDCLVRDCKIKLTSEFVASRLKVYRNGRHPETKKFVALYGQQHLDNIIHWLERSAIEMGQS